MIFMDSYVLIILSVSAINIILVIFSLKEYATYKREKNEYLFKRKIEEVKDKERKQLVNYITSELHDNISQMISLAIMNSGTLKVEKNEKAFINIQNILNKTLTDVRYLIKTIKLRESFDFDLDYQIEDLINILNQSTSISFSKVGKAPTLDNERKYLLFRILQELLSNILKHSKANSVEVLFENTDTLSILRIAHNGEKFQPVNEDFQKGYGLSNIIENTKLLSGKLHFESENSNVILKLPTTAVLQKRGFVLL
jgi:signal transduction histidine kinase